jgi:hypothetical protein
MMQLHFENPLARPFLKNGRALRPIQREPNLFLRIALRQLPRRAAKANKKADAVECLEAFDRAGILVDGSPDSSGLPFS